MFNQATKLVFYRHLWLYVLKQLLLGEDFQDVINNLF